MGEEGLWEHLHDFSIIGRRALKLWTIVTSVSLAREVRVYDDLFTLRVTKPNCFKVSGRKNMAC